MFLKESGIAIDVAVFKKQHASTVQEENYKFDVGVGMYDFIDGKYRGLDQREEDLVIFGIDPKVGREERVRRNKQYKEMSLEAGRDMRFPKPKKETKKYPLTFESKAGKEIMANKELLKTPLGKKLVEQMEKNAANTPK